MKHASIIFGKHRQNSIFKSGVGPNGGEFYLPYRLLRESFREAGVELSTPDMNIHHDVIFELHINAQRRLSKRPAYAYLYEDPIIRPLNGKVSWLSQYRKVFTSNEMLIDDRTIFRLDYPNDLSSRPVPSFSERNLFCVMIASNKALLYPHPHNLHNKRVETIRYFESHAPELFSLYGRGWNIPAVRPGITGRLIKRINEWRARIFSGRPFPSYRGPIDNKEDILDRTKFSICYENSRGSPGYLTEKIFDCFTSGCVPIYIGTTHTVHPIPKGCYIDGDQFESYDEMLIFLQGIDAASYAGYQAEIQRFLTAPDSVRFTNAHFCNSLVSSIMSDFAAYDAPTLKK